MARVINNDVLYTNLLHHMQQTTETNTSFRARQLSIYVAKQLKPTLAAVI